VPEPKSRRIILVARPRGRPQFTDFRLEEGPLPRPGDGQLLLRIALLSLDPYMRGRMDDVRSYARPVGLGEVMVGGTVAVVEESRHAGFAVGDVVLSHSGWQTHALSSGEGLVKLDPAVAPPSTALGVLGMPGFTAYAGLLEVGRPRPGETVVVAAASGAVGSAVGQIARLLGARAVGIAGGPGKCAYVKDELGFDVALDHRVPGLNERLAAACPGGVDVYFENVGGPVWDAVFPLLNEHARVPVCGLIAQYSATAPFPGPDRLPVVMRQVLTRSLTIRGFIEREFAALRPAFQKDMAAWVAQGKVRYREDVVEGLERAPEAFIGLLEGKNFGKLLVRVSAL